MNSSWGQTAKQIVTTIGSGNLISLAILALVLSGVAAYFDLHRHSHAVFWSILFITMLIAGAGWLLNGINLA